MTLNPALRRRLSQPSILFEGRFLDKHAGNIIGDSAVAIVELVANAWDAYATDVEITWPDLSAGAPFSIRDNGKGMTPAQFRTRWRTIDYDKLGAEGNKVSPPDDIADRAPRTPYGRNGKGRFAAFKFSDPYIVRTWRDGLECRFQVRRTQSNTPFEIAELSRRDGVEGHGTEITAMNAGGTTLSSEDARELIGLKFLADPDFKVSLDGTYVTFSDVPDRHLHRELVQIDNYGTAEIVTIDSHRSDRTTKQHGIAWRVKNRLVGSTGWIGFDHERILDGRTSEAKRFLFIVMADFLTDSVKADWSGFDAESPAWRATQPKVHEVIKGLLSKVTSDRRKEVKETVKKTHLIAVSKLAPAGRERWTQFVEQVVDVCPSISADEIGQVAGILANLENSTSKYGLLGKLHELAPGDFDSLDKILSDWTVRLAKDALDEIQSRLKLISELDQKLRDKAMDEVGDLQPLIAKSLWVFGPEYESIEFTSNKGMTTVIRQIFGSKLQGSLLRPDFAVIPDGSVGLYSRDSHDGNGEVNGVAKLVIAEIKKPNVTIGMDEKNQPWRYVKELLQKGLINGSTEVTCFVLGSSIEAGENREVNHGVHVTVWPMAYNVFIKRAEKRMLGLRDKLATAPFLQEYVEDPKIDQAILNLVQAHQPDLARA